MTQEERDLLYETSRKLDQFLNEYYRYNFPSKQVFTKDVVFKGGVGFYGNESVNQQAAIAAPSTPSGAYVQAEAQSAVDKINSIRTVLQNLGLIA